MADLKVSVLQRSSTSDLHRDAVWVLHEALVGLAIRERPQTIVADLYRRARGFDPGGQGSAPGTEDWPASQVRPSCKAISCRT